MTSVLRDPTKLILSPPRRIKAKGLDETAMSVSCKGLPRAVWVGEVLQRTDDTTLLYAILSCLLEKETWQEYIYIDVMFFEWEFDGNVIQSCNPFLELLMRCVRKLVMTFNAVTEKRCLPDTTEMDDLVAGINLAFEGLENNDKGDLDLCLSVFQPALFFPPHLRAEHASRFEKRGVEVTPGISVNAIQTMIYMVLAETWMCSLEDTTKKMIQVPSERGDLFQRASRLSLFIQKIYKDVLHVSSGAFSGKDEYMTYIRNRYDPEQMFSDFCRIHLLAKAFCLERKEIILDKNMLKSVAHSYVDEIYVKLREIIKLNSFIWNNKKKNISTCIKMFHTGESKEDYAFPYNMPYVGNVEVDMAKIRSLENGNIPLNVETFPTERTESSILLEPRRDFHSCFPCLMK